MNIKQLSYYLLLVIFFISACEEGGSIYNNDYEPEKPDPVINSISPSDGYLAGVESITINGANFSDNPEEVIVNFSGAAGEILEATENTLVVRPGIITGDSIEVQVAVRGAISFSNTFLYKLDPALYDHPGMPSLYRPVSAIAIDEEESIYGRFNMSGSTGFYRITKDGEVSIYSQTTRFSNYTGMKFGPDGGLYVVSPETPNAAVFRIPPGGNPDGVNDEVWAYPPFSDAARFADLTFDGNGYLWVVGNNSNIYRFDYADKSMQRFPFQANLRSVFVYENSLYVAGTETGTTNNKVWKFDINGSGAIGAAEVFYDFSSEFSGTIRSILFSDDGTLFMAVSDGENGIITYKNGIAEPYYPHVVDGSYFSLVWDEDRFLIGAKVGAENDAFMLNKIDTYDKSRATFFGIE